MTETATTGTTEQATTQTENAAKVQSITVRLTEQDMLGMQAIRDELANMSDMFHAEMMNNTNLIKAAIRFTAKHMRETTEPKTETKRKTK